MAGCTPQYRVSTGKAVVLWFQTIPSTGNGSRWDVRPMLVKIPIFRYISEYSTG